MFLWIKLAQLRDFPASCPHDGFHERCNLLQRVESLIGARELRKMPVGQDKCIVFTLLNHPEGLLSNVTEKMRIVEALNREFVLVSWPREMLA